MTFRILHCSSSCTLNKNKKTKMEALIEAYKVNIGKDEMSWMKNILIFLPSTNVKKEF